MLLLLKRQVLTFPTDITSDSSFLSLFLNTAHSDFAGILSDTTEVETELQEK